MRFILTVAFLAFMPMAFSQRDSIPRRLEITGPVVDMAVTDTMGELAIPRNKQVYKLKPAVDIPLTAVNTAWSLYAFTKIYNKDTTPAHVILALDPNDLSWYNRFGTRHYNPDAFTSSDLFFYPAMPLPLLFLADPLVRKDFMKMMFLYLETMSITGILYTGSVYFKDKFRPYTYNPDVPLSKRTRGGGRNSFYAGHVALVATSTFFMSKVYADYHPGSPVKWIPYTIASGATLATAYLRGRAGEHFLSDIILGTAQGVLTGILVPHFHRNRIIKNENISVIPLVGQQNGFSIVYKL